MGGRESRCRIPPKWFNPSIKSNSNLNEKSKGKLKVFHPRFYLHKDTEYLHSVGIPEETHLRLPVGISRICLNLLYETKCLYMFGEILQAHLYIGIQDLSNLLPSPAGKLCRTRIATGSMVRTLFRWF